VAYNSPVFVTVSRYDRLGPYLSLYNIFVQIWDYLSCLKILRSKCQVSEKVARNGP